MNDTEILRLALFSMGTLTPKQIGHLVGSGDEVVEDANQTTIDLLEHNKICEEMAHQAAEDEYHGE